MTPINPHLIRAVYDWLVLNKQTPFITIDTTISNVSVPMNLVVNDRIVLNIRPKAVTGLKIDNDSISFKATFSSQIYNIYAPIMSVLMIYSKETGEGLDLSSIRNGRVMAPEKAEEPIVKQKPSLTVVK